MIHKLTFRQTVRADINQIWAFFSKPGNLNRLTPPSMHFRILSGEDSDIYEGQIISYRVRILPLIRVGWVTEIKHVVPFSSFTDEQRFGPYKFWHHRHQFVPVENGVEMIDTIHYAVGFSFLGEIMNRLWVRRQIENIFRYRKEQIEILYGRI